MDHEILYGAVAAIIFQNPENGYTVLRFKTQDGEMVTVVGTIPMTAVGERLAVTGHWTAHASYGRQFEAEVLERYMPESRDEILAYLSSRVIKGIGEKTAQRIVAAFGSESLDVLEHDPERLATLPGISRSKALEISEGFRRQVGMRRLMEFMAAHHLPAHLAVRLYRVYGQDAADALREDPYMLIDAYYGAAFSVVDQFALELGVEAADARRVEAGVVFELVYNQSGGHVFIPREKLAAATAGLLELELETVEAGISRLAESGRLEIDQVAGLEACYLPELYQAEVYLAARFREMAANPPEPPAALERLLQEIAAESEITYAAQQLEAIRAAAENRVVIVTGGPGTGKTTTMAGILRLFDKLKLKTMLAAPTGRAAKRLSECTGRQDASTIHRLLEAQFDPESSAMCFVHDAQTPLQVEAMVVDETSMVDLTLMQSLLLALPPRCRLVLVGDPDQLPSVGPGNVFSDLIRSGVIPTVRLTEIFRQAQKSLIVMNAHAINHGQLPELRAKDRDFFFLKRRTAAEVTETIQELCAKRLPKNMGIAPAEIQVLSPTRKGECGTKNLNQLLQAVLNPPSPGKKEKKYGDFSFREGDRVMQIRNNYDILWKKRDGTMGAGIFNGDVGQVTAISYAEEQMVVTFDDREAAYDFAMLSELEPAYAITVHKSQGSEYRAVVLTAWRGSPYLLTRSVLYTAVTRAKELLILVGDENVVAAMTNNDRQLRRYSGLKLRLQGRVGA